MSTKKVPALLLTLGGAPQTWHIVGGSYVHPTVPSPVGGQGELSLEKAKELDASEGADVELVEITEAAAEKARAARDANRTEGIQAARDARKAGKKATAAEAEQVATEAAAAAGKE